jgi:hypothetical protein
MATERARHKLLLETLVGDLLQRRGIAGASASYVVPLSILDAANGFSQGFLTPSQSPVDAASNPAVRVDVVSDGYFRTLGTGIVRGRSFGAEDRRESARTVIINETLARVAWPGVDPLGKQLRLVPTGAAPLPPRIVVGVSADMLYHDLRGAEPTAYIPDSQSEPGTVLVVRSAGQSASAVATIRRLIREIDPGYAVGSVYSGDELLNQALLRTKLLAWALLLVSVSVLVLVAVGLYGVLAYAVRLRTREIGVRLALGAAPWQVQELVVREAAILVTCGVAVALPVTIALSRVIRRTLYQVVPGDVASLVYASLALLLVGLVSSLSPSRRAGTIDPSTSLRAE